ncbi:vWA domain-containing protein [Granulicoccus sp. GXG6511]|uniref:vWA domain-containing protein n=1 Tax=Granulicoccus sp. GXG6511 TaxID=3381351 RepID=UPI003D7E2CB6
MRARTIIATALGAVTALISVPALAFGAGVNPISVSDSLNPGDVVHITKTVSTPSISPKPDILFLIDNTASMSGAIANVRSGMNNIITSVKAAQPDAQFAVATYADMTDLIPFAVATNLTSDAAVAQTAVDSIPLTNGNDWPEDQINALWQVSDGGAIAWRTGSSRIVVWVGNAYGHDPSNGHTMVEAIASLSAGGVRVVAIDAGIPNLGLDQTGQATAISQGTGGSLYTGVDAAAVSTTILSGLTSIPATVTAAPICDAGLSISLTPASRTVPSGSDAVFDETLTVAPGATPGATLTCSVPFSINGAAATAEYTQKVTVTVKEAPVSPLAVTCAPGPNPSGKVMPNAAQSGFIRLESSGGAAPVTLTIKDAQSAAVFGPYADGTTIKLTQAPGAKPSVSPFTGAVNKKVVLKGDAVVTATDADGNTATATCGVPPSR